jgi:hypothetical protein
MGVNHNGNRFAFFSKKYRAHQCNLIKPPKSNIPNIENKPPKMISINLVFLIVLSPNQDPQARFCCLIIAAAIVLLQVATIIPIRKDIMPTTIFSIISPPILSFNWREDIISSRRSAWWPTETNFPKPTSIVTKGPITDLCRKPECDLQTSIPSLTNGGCRSKS